jgi:hypothetical protein
LNEMLPMALILYKEITFLFQTLTSSSYLDGSV